MFRLGNGQKVENVQEFLASQIAQGRSTCLYCSQRDAKAWVDDLGELVATTPDGTEIRRHAHIAATTYRSGNPKIACNRVIVGNPARYREWQAIPGNDKGWMAEWTYYPDSQCDELVARHMNTSEVA